MWYVCILIFLKIDTDRHETGTEDYLLFRLLVFVCLFVCLFVWVLFFVFCFYFISIFVGGWPIMYRLGTIYNPPRLRL